METLIFIALWAACGFVSYGAHFAYFQGHWPAIAKSEYYTDVRRCIILALFGPIGLLLSPVSTRFYRYGWRLR